MLSVRFRSSELSNIHCGAFGWSLMRESSLLYFLFLFWWIKMLFGVLFCVGETCCQLERYYPCRILASSFHFS
jgi:hypothetical protein